MGYYDDDGNELNPDLIPKPGLCIICRKNDDPDEELICDLTSGMNKNSNVSPMKTLTTKGIDNG